MKKYVIVCFVATFLFVLLISCDNNKRIEISELSNISKKEFGDIWTKICDINHININKDSQVDLLSGNFYFNFDSEKNIKNFICTIEINKEDNKKIAYQLMLNDNKVIATQSIKKISYAEVNFNMLLNCFDNIDYDFLLNHLTKGDLYKFALYPEKSINHSDYLYKKEDYGNYPFFLCENKKTIKIQQENYIVKQKSILFLLCSMKENTISKNSKEYIPIDKVYVIIPVE